MATPAIPTQRGSIGCGTLFTAPTSGTVGVISGEPSTVPFFLLKFGFTAARIPWTDGAASGAFGVLKLMTFNEGVITLLGANQRWTALAEIGAIGAGVLAGVIGFGTVSGVVHDGTLTGTEVDWCATRSFTLPATGFGTVINQAGVLAGIDGTTTAKDVWLNVAGTAASSVASGSLDMTGYFNIWGVMAADV